MLVDAGIKSAGYTSDITRTFPVNIFSDAQRQLFEVLLDVQKVTITTIKNCYIHGKSNQKNQKMLQNLDIGFIQARSQNTALKTHCLASFIMD